jgi:hypothetical protein
MLTYQGEKRMQMKAQMQIRLTAMPLALLALLLTIVTQMLLAQNTPLTLGELFVVVKNSSAALSITAVASGTVGGSRCDHYTITTTTTHGLVAPAAPGT